MRNLLMSVLLCSLTASVAIAQEDDQFSKIKQTVKEQTGNEPTSITASPVKGLYEVIAGGQIVYMTSDAHYVFSGDLLDMKTKVNVTDSKRDSVRLSALNSVSEKDMIIFAPKETKHTITVFTDIDCGYCRKLHNEIAEYNKLGIKVRYLAYPRAGIPSDSYNKAVTVWCSDDRKKAITAAKNGENLPNKTCDNPVAHEFELGQQLGVTGTPALILENGKLYPGYAPAKQLSDLLDKMKNGKKKS